MKKKVYKEKVCITCNNSFIPHSSGQLKCRKCLYMKKCLICKIEFDISLRYKRVAKVQGSEKIYCSKDCSNKGKVLNAKATLSSRYGEDIVNPSQIPEVKKRIKENNLKKYGVTHPMKTQEISDKVKETTRKNWGADSIFKVPEIQQQIKETNLRIRGVDNPSKCPKIKKKMEKTFIDKYGVKNPFQSDEVKEKIANRYEELYGEGIRHSSQVPGHSDLVKQSKLTRYGNENYNNPEKAKETCREKYNVDNFRQREDLIIGDYGKQKKSTDSEFIEVVKNWRVTHGRMPTLEDLKLHWGYSATQPVGLRIKNLSLSDFVDKQDSFLELKIKDFLDEFGINYKRRDKTQIKPLELDFWLHDYNVAIEVNDFLTHNSSYNPWGEPKPKDYHINKTKLCRDKGIRLIHAWEDQILDEAKFKVLKNAVLHACGKSLNKVYARNTRIEVRPAIEMKNFFNENNIAGYRGAKDVYVLVCKKTNEDLMAYSVGHARFGKGKYDAEIIRGASKLGYTVVGGASKLWKYIIKNTNYNSIVYYVDLNTYAGESMNFLENVEFVSEQPGLKNYWVKEKKLKNREPSRHKEIVELTKQGDIWAIWDAGVQVNVWHRK